MTARMPALGGLFSINVAIVDIPDIYAHTAVKKNQTPEATINALFLSESSAIAGGMSVGANTNVLFLLSGVGVFLVFMSTPFV